MRTLTLTHEHMLPIQKPDEISYESFTLIEDNILDYNSWDQDPDVELAPHSIDEITDMVQLSSEWQRLEEIPDATGTINPPSSNNKFRLQKPIQDEEGGDIRLVHVLRASYQHPKEKTTDIEAIKKEGYNLDHDLSNRDLKVFYRAKTKQLLYIIAGSHNFTDFAIIDPIYFFTGMINYTNRFKETKSTLKKAKEKYQPEKTTVAGHSLGATLAQKVADADDTIVTYNKFARPGQKNGRKELSIRHQWDWFSIFVKSDKNTVTITTNKQILNPFRAHDIENLNKTEFVVK